MAPGERSRTRSTEARCTRFDGACLLAGRVAFQIAAALAAPGRDLQLVGLRALDAGPDALARLAGMPGADRVMAVALIDDEPIGHRAIAFRAPSGRHGHLQTEWPIPTNRLPCDRQKTRGWFAFQYIF